MEWKEMMIDMKGQPLKWLITNLENVEVSNAPDNELWQSSRAIWDDMEMSFFQNIPNSARKEVISTQIVIF